MKNAKNKLTKETAAQRGWKQIERDTMPKQVATDMLCTAGIPMTSQVRKAYEDARCVLFCSLQEKKPAEVKLQSKFMEATVTQLSKWKKRCDKSRRGVQRKYETAQKLPEETQLQQLMKARLIAALDLAAARLDLVLNGIEDALGWRLGLTRGIVSGSEGNELRSWRGRIFQFCAHPIMLGVNEPPHWKRVQ